MKKIILIIIFQISYLDILSNNHFTYFYNKFEFLYIKKNLLYIFFNKISSFFNHNFLLILTFYTLLSIILIFFFIKRIKNEHKVEKESILKSKNELFGKLHAKSSIIEDLKNTIKENSNKMQNRIDEEVLISTRLNSQKEEIQSQTEKLKLQTEELYNINQELEKLSVVANGTDNAVLIMDKDGNFEWANDSFKIMYGYNINELISDISPNIIGKKTSRYVKDMFDKCITTKKTVRYEQKITTKYNNIVWIQVTLTPILDENNNIKKLIAIDSDITKVKKAEKAIKNQNQNIKASIKYARTIQNAFLPNKDELNKLFDNFIIYKPKDIVSGDFYWLSVVHDSIFFEEANNLTFIAVADCTGHGVPGAFMSMLGNSLLNEIVNEKEIHDPAEILELLHINVIRVLNQEKTENIDGMDVCLCRIQDDENGKFKLNYAGAKVPLFYVSKKNRKIIRLKGDVKTIGGLFTNDLSFHKHQMIVEKGDMLYLASDGYVDQNGETFNRKSFGTVSFMKLLRVISHRPLHVQKQILENEFNDFKESKDQRDDITIIGIRI